MKLAEAEIAFLGPFDQSLVSMDMNMEMGKGMGECQGPLGQATFKMQSEWNF